MAAQRSLEERIAALEAAQALGALPSYAPNGGQVVAEDGSVTYDFSGTVHATGGDFTGTVHATGGDFTGTVHATGGDFTGHVQAEGLDLDTSDSANQPDSQKVRWLSTGVSTKGLPAAEISTREGALILADLKAREPSSPATNAVLRLAVNQINGTQFAQIITNDGSPDAKAVTLLNGAGGSDFLRLAATAVRAVDAGLVSLHFNASAFSDVAAVPHQLGRAPVGIACLPFLSSSGIAAALIPALVNGSVTAAQFGLQARTANGVAIGPGNVSALWIALG